MKCGFRPRIVIERPRGWRGLDGLLGHFERVLTCNTHEAFMVPRLTVGISNELQMTRNLIGGLPVVYQGRLANHGSFRECLTPAHNRRQKGNAGGHRSAELQNGQRGKCSDA